MRVMKIKQWLNYLKAKKYVQDSHEKRVFKIDVGNIEDSEVEKYVKDIKEHMSRPLVNPQTGEINLKYNPEYPQEDYYITVRDGNLQVI